MSALINIENADYHSYIKTEWLKIELLLFLCCFLLFNAIPMVY